MLAIMKLQDVIKFLNETPFLKEDWWNYCSRKINR
jgi:hypothetical protein